MENLKKYQKVLEIAKLAKKMEDDMRDQDAEAEVQSSGVKKVNENTIHRNFIVEAKEILEKKTKDEDPC